MSQLVIVDVQNKFSLWFNESDLLKNLEEVSKNYSSVVYLWDNINGDDFQEELPEEWNDSWEMDENEEEIQKDGFYRNFSYVIEKQYGFFRSYMDKGIGYDDLALLGKFMLQNEIGDIREIKDNPALEAEFKEKFNDDILSLYKTEESFYLPMDLIQMIRESCVSGLTLTGGGVDECLAEISLLLDVLEIEHKVDYALTY